MAKTLNLNNCKVRDFINYICDNFGLWEKSSNGGSHRKFTDGRVTVSVPDDGRSSCRISGGTARAILRQLENPQFNR